MFNIEDIDSMSDKKIIYNIENMYLEDTYTLYLKEVNCFNLQKILFDMDLHINSFLVNNEKYYVSNVYDLLEKYTEDMSLENKIYYETKGIKIDAITLRCNVKNIIDLESENLIY